MQRMTRETGFTMIELLVVLVIIGLLAGLVGPQMFGKVDSSKVKTAETQIKMLKGALQTYRLDVGSFPAAEDGLTALIKKPASGPAAAQWQGPYLDEEIPADPWGGAYQYKPAPGSLQGFSLYSFGADGKQGGEAFDADVGYLPE
jgi:general secretion pathway protein G